MEIRQLTIEDAYRELNDIVGVIAVIGDGADRLCVEYKDTDARNAIEQFLDGTTWEVAETTDLAGQYPRVYVGLSEEHRKSRK
jgi:hypothetical protein